MIRLKKLYFDYEVSVMDDNGDYYKDVILDWSETEPVKITINTSLGGVDIRFDHERVKESSVYDEVGEVETGSVRSHYYIRFDLTGRDSTYNVKPKFYFENGKCVTYSLPNDKDKMIQELKEYIDSGYNRLPGVKQTSLEKAAELLDNDEFEDI